MEKVLLGDWLLESGPSPFPFLSLWIIRWHGKAGLVLYDIAMLTVATGESHSLFVLDAMWFHRLLFWLISFHFCLLHMQTHLSNRNYAEPFLGSDDYSHISTFSDALVPSTPTIIIVSI